MTRKDVSRFGVSVPSELLSEFDGTIALMNYDRSKVIQLAMRNFLTEHIWTKEEGSAA